MIRPWTLATLLVLASCGGGEPVAETAPPEAPAADEASSNPEAPTLDKEELASSADNIALVPSIVETQKALAASGIDSELAKLITERTFDMNSAETEKVAVRTGVILADLLLTAKTADTEKLVAHFDSVNNGMQQLGGGSDIQSTINEYKDQLKAESISRDALVRELDELSGAVIPELSFNGKNRIVPLIQAGSWLEGANLVAKAVKAKGEGASADGLLKQPAVVAYFQKYVTEEGAETAPEGVAKQLESALATLKGLADKAEPLSSEDIDTIIKTTDDVLALL
jgi:hypothetical protein